MAEKNESGKRRNGETENRRSGAVDCRQRSYRSSRKACLAMMADGLRIWELTVGKGNGYEARFGYVRRKR